MYVITIAFKAGNPFQLNFIGGLNAQKVYADLEKRRHRWYTPSSDCDDGHSLTEMPQMLIELTDDYGHTISIDVCEIAGVMMSDVKKEMDARGEIAFQQSLAQAELNKRIQSQPGARLVAPANFPMQ